MAIVEVSAIKTSPEELIGLLQKARQNETPEEVLQRLEKRLRAYEEKYGLTSGVFFERFNCGEMGDTAEIMSWAGDYRSYLRLQEVFRYDNAPHHPDVPTFPHHKHVAGQNRPQPCEAPTLYQVLLEIIYEEIPRNGRR